MGKPWENGDLYGKSQFLMGKKVGFLCQWIGFLRKIYRRPMVFYHEM